MTGYIFLAITVFIGVSKGYCGKKSSAYINGITDGLIMQAMRLILCVVIGAVLFAFNNSTQIDFTVVLISLLNGTANAVFLLSWLFAVKKGAYLFVDICLTSGGILIPCILSSLLFGDKITALQYIGIIIMLIAVFVMNGYNSAITKKKIKYTEILLLLCVAISNGLMGFCEKYFSHHIKNTVLNCDLSVFSLMSFAFAAIILLAAIFLICAKNQCNIINVAKTFPLKQLWIYILLISALLFFDSYFTTLTNTFISNTVLIYPLKFGSNLILSAIMAATLFKEKINLQSVLGMFLITVSIVFINVI